jgi:transposase
MANLLKMPIVQSIISLHALGWSARRIAGKLGVDRETVSRYVRAAAASGPKPASAPILPGRVPGASKPASAPIGAPAAAAEAVEPSQPAEAESATAPILAAGSDHRNAAPSASGPPAQAGQQSRAAVWQEFILAQRREGLSAKRIHQDLIAQHGAQVSYDSVRRLLKRLGAARPLPFRRLECAPGEEAQVDFGSGAPIVTADGKRRKTYVFRIVLSHSRKAYSEACFRQTTDDFLRCLENAFAHFGGVPKTLVIDNLKAAVAHPDWFDPELTPKVQAFSAHYGTVILPTKPYTPRHKGKVEAGVKYVQDNGLKGRVFPALEAENRHLAHWEETVADTRIHGTTKRQVGRVFAEVERRALSPLPAERFPSFQEAQRKVNRDGHVEVAKAYYSAPIEYLGRSVWARWDTRLVHLFNQRFEQIAVHLRQEPGRFSTLSPHIAAEKISGLERGAAHLLRQVDLIGPQARRWADAMVTARGIAGTRVLQGLLALGKKHTAETLETACETALSYGAFRLRTLRKLLASPGRPQTPLPFLEEHPIIRPLEDYGRIVAQAIHRQGNRSSMSEGFFRHGWTKECGAGGGNEKGPADPRAANQRSLAVTGEQSPTDIPPPRPGYPSLGCSSAEPNSVSPDNPSIVPNSTSFHQEHDHA